jgi:hypothetical protein
VTGRSGLHAQGRLTPEQDAAWRRLWDRLLAEPQENDKPRDVAVTAACTEERHSAGTSPG